MALGMQVVVAESRNRATKSFILITVPHTGTRFVRRFLRSTLQAEYLAKGSMLYTKRGRTTAPTFAHIHPIQGYNTAIVKNTTHLPLVITLRHPYMHFLTSWDILIINRGAERVRAYSKYAWKNMIELYPKYSRKMVIPVDMPMTLDERVELLYGLAAFVRAENYEHLDIVQYADAWHPEGTRGYYDIKMEYLDEGKMPCDMGFLDFAVSWYYEQINICKESLVEADAPSQGDKDTPYLHVSV